MKSTAMLVILTFTCASGATPALAPAQGAAGAGFEKLKGLVGEWEGKSPDGAPGKVSYRLVSGGSALMEELSVGNMVTMYHLDGDTLMLTHYCEGQNQPRMRANPTEGGGNTLRFRFVDATNLKDKADGYMRSLTVTFQDPDHFTQEWVHMVGGKEEPMTLKWERRK